ncbi:DNA polymerase III subunit epsilon [Pelagibaculum spongiae]|uniref:DNA polymerase III subunit epsilon n=1 Tax=Pelagibaculum spongiae TaxID=2080658 RepID=A0A2V1GV66_9GAMM|nr:DNA polymerase III subunit epsilon [Pelagibaculum spongiae]PVZ69581.1 DNA polymerase III subunit epsilon [Pelagibaculum spongiae]
MSERKIILDTETTGIEISAGNRLIEIGCVEVINRKFTGRTYHQYVNPQRDVEQGAFEVHGISDEFLKDKPLFSAIAEDFVRFIDGAELVIHNAAFDVGFLNHELGMVGGYKKINQFCTITDTLMMARQMYPGQRNNLDALCKRLGVDNSKRELHGALLDAEILADVYLMLTGGQVSIGFNADQDKNGQSKSTSSNGEAQKLPEGRAATRIIRAAEGEIEQHQKRMTAVAKAAGGSSIWQIVSEQ